MITRSNNVATYSIKSEDDSDCHFNTNKFVLDTLVILVILCTKRGMKLQTALHNKGISGSKLFGEWK